MEAITLEQQILGSIRSLPVQQQHEVLNFAQFLHQKAAPKPPRRSLKGLGADLKIQITPHFLTKLVKKCGVTCHGRSSSDGDCGRYTRDRVVFGRARAIISSSPRCTRGIDRDNLVGIN